MKRKKILILGVLIVVVSMIMLLLPLNSLFAHGGGDISLDKTVNPTSAVVGSTVTYTFTITNTSSSYDRTHITLTDNKLGAINISGFAGIRYSSSKQYWLDDGESATGTVTYTIQPGDIGTLTNTATVTAKNLWGQWESDTDNASVIVTAAPAPAISLTKTASSGSANPGDTITYTFVVQNTGNVDLTNVTLSDPMLDFGSGLGVGINLGGLAAGATLAPNPTATYVVQAADIGSLVNIATVTSTQGASDTDSATVAVTATPAPVPGPTTITTVEVAGILNYTITASADSHGTITDKGVTTVLQGSSKTYTMDTVSTDCGIVKVLVDGVSVGKTESYTFTDINADHTIHVITVCSAPSPTGEVAVLGITEEEVEVLGITEELPFTGQSMWLYIIGAAMLALAGGLTFVLKAVKSKG